MGFRLSNQSIIHAARIQDGLLESDSGIKASVKGLDINTDWQCNYFYTKTILAVIHYNGLQIVFHKTGTWSSYLESNDYLFDQNNWTPPEEPAYILCGIWKAPGVTQYAYMCHPKRNTIMVPGQNMEFILNQPIKGNCTFEASLASVSETESGLLVYEGDKKISEFDGAWYKSKFSRKEDL